MREKVITDYEIRQDTCADGTVKFDVYEWFVDGDRCIGTFSSREEAKEFVDGRTMRYDDEEFYILHTDTGYVMRGDDGGITLYGGNARDALRFDTTWEAERRARELGVEDKVVSIDEVVVSVRVTPVMANVR